MLYLVEKGMQQRLLRAIDDESNALKQIEESNLTQEQTNEENEQSMRVRVNLSPTSNQSPLMIKKKTKRVKQNNRD
jgi:hypothetical protein